MRILIVEDEAIIAARPETDEPTAGVEVGGLPAYRLQQVRAYIDLNLGEDLRLEVLAEVAGMSKYHFCRLFRRSAGATPHQYLLGVRIDRAKRLLRRSEDAIGEIAKKVGFNSSSQFNRAFRRLAGMTPTAFRRDFRPNVR